MDRPAACPAQSPIAGCGNGNVTVRGAICQVSEYNKYCRKSPPADETLEQHRHSKRGNTSVVRRSAGETDRADETFPNANSDLPIRTYRENNMTRKPQPLYPPPLRDYCPVCGKVSYSLAGIHPQCAVQQADAKRMKRVKAGVKAVKAVTGSAELKPWHKVCPRCRVLVHVRRSECECGYSFVVNLNNQGK